VAHLDLDVDVDTDVDVDVDVVGSAWGSRPGGQWHHSDGFMQDLGNRTNFHFGSSAIDINSLEASGTLIRTRARRDAQVKKRDFQPVPEAECTRQDTFVLRLFLYVSPVRQ